VGCQTVALNDGLKELEDSGVAYFIILIQVLKEGLKIL
jgi:hypothetical protein